MNISRPVERTVNGWCVPQYRPIRAALTVPPSRMRTWSNSALQWFNWFCSNANSENYKRKSIKSELICWQMHIRIRNILVCTWIGSGGSIGVEEGGAPFDWFWRYPKRRDYSRQYQSIFWPALCRSKYWLILSWIIFLKEMDKAISLRKFTVKQMWCN